MSITDNIIIIKEVLTEAFVSIKKNKKTLTKALAIPFILLLTFDLIGYYSLISMPLILTLVVPLFILSVVVAITTHRIILKGSKSIPTWGLYKFTKRELKYIYYGIGFFIILIPLGMLSTLEPIGKPLAITIMIYLFGRVSLVFPAIATDKPFTFMKSWEVTKKFQFQVIIISAILPIILSFQVKLIEKIPNIVWAVDFISFFITVYVAAALSIVYKKIVVSYEIQNSQNRAVNLAVDNI